MTLAEVKTMLESVNGFTDKVAYRSFPEGSAPKLPFICFLCTGSNNFNADNYAFKKVDVVDIELYSYNKDISSEMAIEAVLDANKLPYVKSEEYLDDEKCFEITYTVEV